MADAYEILPVGHVESPIADPATHPGCDDRSASPRQALLAIPADPAVHRLPRTPGLDLEHGPIPLLRLLVSLVTAARSWLSRPAVRAH
jgi:hypothetical protein